MSAEWYNMPSLKGLAHKQVLEKERQRMGLGGVFATGMQHNPRAASLVSRPSLGCMYRPGIVPAPLLRSYNRMMALLVGSATTAGVLAFSITKALQ